MARGRPAAVKDVIRRNHEYIGVDQRAATQTRADYRVHVVIIADVKEAVSVLAGRFDEFPNLPRTARLLPRKRPEGLRHIVRRPCKGSHWIALAALQDQNLLTRPLLRQPAA